MSNRYSDYFNFIEIFDRVFKLMMDLDTKFEVLSNSKDVGHFGRFTVCANVDDNRVSADIDNRLFAKFHEYMEQCHTEFVRSDHEVNTDGDDSFTTRTTYKRIDRQLQRIDHQLQTLNIN